MGAIEPPSLRLTPPTIMDLSSLRLPKEVRDSPYRGPGGCPPSSCLIIQLMCRHTAQDVIIRQYSTVIIRLDRMIQETHPIVIASPAFSGRGNLRVSPLLQDCFAAIAPRNDSGKGSPEGFPSGWGLDLPSSLCCHPAQCVIIRLDRMIQEAC